MGRIWLFGDNVTTDAIIPGRRNITTDEKELARYAFEHARPSFSREVRDGDLIVAGNNFGCGSSREHAALAIKASGVNHIVAKSFALIFYRNCINSGLYPLKSAEDMKLRDGDTARVDLKNFEFIGPTGASYKLIPLPPFLLDIISEGGLIRYLNRHKTFRISGR